MKIESLAKSINIETVNFRCFWAIGLIKQTLPLWAKPHNFNLLNETAKIFANHYLMERSLTNETTT